MFVYHALQGGDIILETTTVKSADVDGDSDTKPDSGKQNASSITGSQNCAVRIQEPIVSTTDVFYYHIIIISYF